MDTPSESFGAVPSKRPTLLTPLDLPLPVETNPLFAMSSTHSSRSGDVLSSSPPSPRPSKQHLTFELEDCLEALSTFQLQTSCDLAQLASEFESTDAQHEAIHDILDENQTRLEQFEKIASRLNEIASVPTECAPSCPMCSKVALLEDRLSVQKSLIARLETELKRRLSQDSQRQQDDRVARKMKRKVRELEGLVAQMETKIKRSESARNLITSTSRELDDLQNRLTRERQRVIQLKAVMKQGDAAHSRLLMEKDKEMAGLRRQLKAETDRRISQSTQFETESMLFVEKIAQLKTDVAVARERMAGRMEADVRDRLTMERLRSVAERARQSEEEVSTELSQLQTELQRREEAIDDLEGAATKAKQTIRSLETQIECFRNEALTTSSISTTDASLLRTVERRKRISEQEQGIRELRSQLVRNRQSTRDSVLSLQNQLAENEEGMLLLKPRFTRMSDELAFYREQSGTLQRKVERCLDRQRSLERNLEARDDEIDDLKAQIERLRMQNRSKDRLEKSSEDEDEVLQASLTGPSIASFVLIEEEDDDDDDVEEAEEERNTTETEFSTNEPRELLPELVIDEIQLSSGGEKEFDEEVFPLIGSAESLILDDVDREHGWSSGLLLTGSQSLHSRLEAILAETEEVF